jgi:Rrf2 family protein
MLSQKAKYALRAALLLAGAAEDEPMQAADLAGTGQIPRKFLEAILVELRNHGIVEARRGRNGGYRLAKPPGEISFGDIIRIIDGPLAPIRCASRTQFMPCAECPDVEGCSIRAPMLRARDAMAAVLDGWTLAHAVRQAREPGSLSFDAAG